MEPDTASKKESDAYWKAKLDIKLDASASKRFTREEANDRPVCRERAQNPSTGSVL